MSTTNEIGLKRCGLILWMLGVAACSTDTSGLRAQDVVPTPGSAGLPNVATGGSGGISQAPDGSLPPEGMSSGGGTSPTDLFVFNGLWDADVRLVACESAASDAWPSAGLAGFHSQMWPLGQTLAADLELTFFAVPTEAVPADCYALMAMPRRASCPLAAETMKDDAGFDPDAGVDELDLGSIDAGVAESHRVGSLLVTASSLSAGWAHAAVVTGCADACSTEPACEELSLLGLRAETSLVAFGDGEGSRTTLQVMHASLGLPRLEVSLIANLSSTPPLSLAGGLELGQLRPRDAAAFSAAEPFSGFVDVEVRSPSESVVRRWPLELLWSDAGLDGAPATGEHLMVVAGGGPLGQDDGRRRVGWVAAMGR